MSPFSALRRSRPPAAVLPFLLALLLAVPAAFGQTDPNNSGGGAGGGGGGGGGGAGGGGNGGTLTAATPGSTPNFVGYGSIATGTIPSSTTSFVSGMTSGTVFVVPFAFDSLGNYSLTSVSLLLSSSTGTADRSDFSLNVFSSQPTSLSLPTAVATFSATGAIGSSQAIYTFSADSSPTLAANTIYFLGVSYGGADSVDWNATAAATTLFATDPLSDTFADGTLFSYDTVTSGGASVLQDNMGGFSIAASAIGAIPEPATAGMLAAGAILAAALGVRWGRRRSAVSNPDPPSPDTP